MYFRRMEIRKRLTYQFSTAVALIMVISFMAIYLSFVESRKAEFNDRLSRKSKLVAQMVVDIDEIDLNLLKKIEENNPLNLANERIMIFNSSDSLIFTNGAETNLIISNKLLQKVRLDKEISFRQGPYEINGLLYKSKGSEIVVFTGATDIFGRKKIGLLLNILIFTFFISLVFIFLIGRYLANRALNPIGKMISRVDEISISNLDARINEGNGKDEIARLAITFNNMMNRLETAFKIQKTFIANASHELRNPLNVLTGQMEVVLMTDRSKKEYFDTLKSVYEDAVGINHLANSLLLLAQTSLESTTQQNFTIVRIDDILWQAAYELKNIHPDFQIRTNFSDSVVDDDSMTVFGNEILLKTAFINLLQNSYKYSDKHEIEILVDFKSKFVVIEFRDYGIGIPDNEINLIFNPFFRSSNAFHRKGHGIGLTLVDNITKLHKGFITVNSKVGSGTIFTVYLPTYIHLQTIQPQIKIV